MAGLSSLFVFKEHDADVGQRAQNVAVSIDDLERLPARHRYRFHVSVPTDRSGCGWRAPDTWRWRRNGEHLFLSHEANNDSVATNRDQVGDKAEVESIGAPARWRSVRANSADD